MRTPVSLGVVGPGRRGTKVARAFDDSPLADLRWVYDGRPASLPRRRPRGAPTFDTDFHELLADETLDAVVVATPATARWALARKALEADKHVFVDGVLGVGARETGELIGLAARRHRRLMIGPALLFDPGVRKLRELIEVGRLGDVYYLTATFTSSEPEQVTESVLLADAGAAVATLLYVLGDEPIGASWAADSYVHTHPEIATCSLRFATGIAATLQTSWLDAREQCRIEVIGSRRTAVFDAGEPSRKLTIYEKGSARGAEIVSPRLVPGKPLRLQCEAFLAGVRAAVEYPGTRLAPAVARVLDAALSGGAEAPERPRARPTLRLAAVRGERHDEPSLSTHPQPC